jgi:hypothetical protein
VSGWSFCGLFVEYFAWNCVGPCCFSTRRRVNGRLGMYGTPWSSHSAEMRKRSVGGVRRTLSLVDDAGLATSSLKLRFHPKSRQAVVILGHCVVAIRASVSPSPPPPGIPHPSLILRAFSHDPASSGSLGRISRGIGQFSKWD